MVSLLLSTVVVTSLVSRYLAPIFLGTLLVFLSGCQDPMTVQDLPKKAYIIYSDHPSDSVNLSWHFVPENWTSKASDGFRKASFDVAENQRVIADVSIIRFEEQMGSLISNINRWRAQLQLAPIESYKPESFLNKFGIMVNVIQIHSDKGSILVGMLKSSDDVDWFIKLKSEAPVSEDQMKFFYQFLYQLEFQNSSSKGADR